MSNADSLVRKITTSDILRLLDKLGVPEGEVRYGNDSIILPTICHNELLSTPSYKLYYYEETKRFYCYTHCGSMSIFDFVINTYAARGLKINFTQAYSLIDGILENRQKTGFAIINNPRIIKTNKIEPGWEEAFTEYSPNVLACFTKQPRYLAPWLDEGIDYDVLVKYGVCFDMVRNRIVFPVRNHRGRLIGIKVRNFNEKDLDEHRKYMPLWHNNELYNYPKRMIAYGLYENKSTIRRAGEAIVFEAEKSVLKFDSYFTQNRSVAIGGSSFSAYHALLLKELGVEKITLAFDNDWEGDNKKYGLMKTIESAIKIKKMGFKVDVIYDFDEDTLDNKDAPVDKGRAAYSKLYRHRRDLDSLLIEFKPEEKETNEISNTKEEL